MGLADRLANHYQTVLNQAETTRLQVAKQAADLLKQQQAQIAAQLQAAEVLAQQEAKKRNYLIAKLAPLLDVVDAKGQLEQVRLAWTVGEIDSAPDFIPDINRLPGNYKPTDLPQPGLGLALRHKYYDSEPMSVSDLEISGSYNTSSVHEKEGALYVLVGLHNRLPFVTSFYATHYLKTIYSGYDPRRNSGSCPSVGSERINYSAGLPLNMEKIKPRGLVSSRTILEDQLFVVCARVPKPADLHKEAKARIATDTYLPDNIKKEYGSKPPSQTLSWFKRIFG